MENNIFKSRLTKTIRANTALNIVKSFDYAKFIGRPLNMFITISFEERHDLIKVNKIFRSILNKTTRWNNSYSEKHGLAKLKPVWIYVFENPQFNPHVHWCLNIRKEQIIQLEDKLKIWLEKLQGVINANSIHVSLINPYTDKALANYHVKGVDQKYIGLLHLQKIARYQGPIWGQRARVAKEIGPTAIKRSGFKADRDRDKWEVLHPWIADGFIKPASWNVKKVVPKKHGITFGQLSKYWNNFKRKCRSKGAWFIRWKTSRGSGRSLHAS